MAKEDDNQCIPVYCGIFIVHGGLKFVDFVGNPYPRMFNKIINSLALKCNKSSYVRYPQNFIPMNHQNLDNPRTLAPTNKNDSTVLFYIP